MNTNDRKNTTHAMIAMIIAVVLLIIAIALTLLWVGSFDQQNAEPLVPSVAEETFSERWNDGFESVMGFLFDWTNDFGTWMNELLNGES